MEGNTTTKAPSTPSPHFVTYVTASVVFFVFVLTLCFFCLILEVRRRREKRRLPHIIRPMQRSKENYYDKSPVLSSVYDEDMVGYAPDPGLSNPSYDARLEEGSLDDQRTSPHSEDSRNSQNEGSRDSAEPISQDPEYDFLQDDGYLRPDLNSEHHVAFITIPEESGPVFPYGIPISKTLPNVDSSEAASSPAEVNNQAIVLSIQSSVGQIEDHSAPNYEPISAETSYNVGPDDASEVENPVYATVSEEPIYHVVPEEPVTACSADLVDGSNHMDTSDSDISEEFDIYDNNINYVVKDDVPDAESDDDETFVTIEDVVHCYERIPFRTKVNSSSGQEGVVGLGYVADNEYDNETNSICSEEHIYEALPENGFTPGMAAESNVQNLDGKDHAESDLAVYNNFISHLDSSPYINVDHDSHSTYLSMDGTLNRGQKVVRQGSTDDYLPMEGQATCPPDPQANDLYSYAHLPGHTHKDQTHKYPSGLACAMADNEIYSLPMDFKSAEPLADWTDEDSPMADGEAGLEDDSFYEVIDAALDNGQEKGLSDEQTGTDKSQGCPIVEELEAVCLDTVTRSYSLNNLDDLSDYYNVNGPATCSSVHWGSVHDVSDSQLVLCKEDNTPARARTLSRTFTSKLSLNDDSSIYDAWASTNVVFLMESEA